MTAEADIAAIRRHLAEMRQVMSDPDALERVARRLREQRRRPPVPGLNVERANGRSQQR